MSRPFPEKRQRGFLALDALVWAGAFLGFMAIAGYLIREVSLHSSAQAAGKYAAQVALAVRSKIASENVAAVTAGATGVKWLQSIDDCADGTAPASTPSYLPICGFPDEDPAFGMTVTTDIVATTPTVATATITIGKFPRPFADRLDLVNTIRRTIELSDPGQTLATPATFFQVNYESDVATATSTAAGSTAATYDIVITISGDATSDPYIRADGTKAWNTGVTQDLDTSQFINVGRISADGSAPAAGDIEMNRFVDADNNTFLLDPHDQSTLNKVAMTEASIDLITNDPELDLDGDGTGDLFLSNALIHSADVVDQGAVVVKPTCPNGTPEIHGGIAAIVATDNPSGGGGSFNDPKNMKGFAVFHDSSAETATTWTVYALAFVDDESLGYELQPPSGLVRISVYTKCG